MRTVKVSVELADQRCRAYEEEARHLGVTLEEVVERVIRGLLRELDQEEREGTGYPIIVS